MGVPRFYLTSCLDSINGFIVIFLAYISSLPLVSTWYLERSTTLGAIRSLWVSCSKFYSDSVTIVRRGLLSISATTSICGWWNRLNNLWHDVAYFLGAYRTQHKNPARYDWVFVCLHNIGSNHEGFSTYVFYKPIWVMASNITTALDSGVFCIYLVLSEYSSLTAN